MPSFKHTLTSLALSLAALSAHAAAPFVGTQAPGYFRVQLGDFEVTALSDGAADLPMSKILVGEPAEIQKGLDHAYLKSPTTTSFNGYLVNTGAKLVLIDTGAGGLFGSSLGKLLGNLEAAGYKPEQVDEIYITHMHTDHVGGLSSNGQRVFPNAIVRVAQADADYWLSPSQMDKAPAEARGFFQAAMASLKPYADAGALKPFAASGELTPGIRAVLTRGHTPGHSYYVVESKGAKLAVWGDLIHAGAVQFAHPGVAIQFDIDTKTAIAERKKAFDAAVKDGELAAGAHLSFPGLGHLRKMGAGYEWIPLNYPGAVPAKP
jgi:glyoxylase-like metal-dependent hydrolase (beta-lactamase superfamily II)